MFYSPLRYPGGKSKLAQFITKICLDNNLRKSYVEPYAGGASVALHLLFNNIVQDIYINDADRSLYAFWFCLTNHPEEFIRRVSEIEISMDTWNIQKAIQERKHVCNIMDLAVSTFFLNRTNRSGILKGGVIGGKNQEGNYKMDCRFNKPDLIKRLEAIAAEASRISVTNLDALDLILLHRLEMDNDGKLAYFDPPYFFKADSLYMNHYHPDDHAQVARHILGIQEFKYLISYDDTIEIRDLYHQLKSKRYSFKHNIINSRNGKEILFFSEGLNLDDLTDKNPIRYKLKRNTKEIVYQP